MTQTYTTGSTGYVTTVGSSLYDFEKAGVLTTSVLSIPEIEMISYKNPVTTIYWTDGTRTTVHLGKGEVYDRYTGFMAAVCKKLFGSTAAAKKICDRFDDEVMKRVANVEREKRYAELKRLKLKREKNFIKRRAKQMVLECKAFERAAGEILKEEEKAWNNFPMFK